MSASPCENLSKKSPWFESYRQPVVGNHVISKKIIKTFISPDITEKMASSRPCVDNGFASHMMKTLARYRDSSTFSDVTVVVGTKEFQCHRIILASTSEFFRLALVSRGMKEDLEGKITLKTIDEDAFSNILSYVYSGELDITRENLFKVWQASDLLQITFIIEECEQFFRNTLCLENCLDYFYAAAILDEQSHLYASDFIANNFAHLRHLESFNQLEPNDLKHVISSERLNIAHEDDLIEFLLKWAEDDPRNDTSNVSPAYCADNPIGRYSVKNVDVALGQASVAANLAEQSDLEVKQLDLAHQNSFTRAQQLVDILLEYTRYFLMSRSFLNETFSCHPLIRDDPRCVALVERIDRYHLQSYLHQEWCPPAAMEREQSETANCLVSVCAKVSEIESAIPNIEGLSLVAFNLRAGLWQEDEIPKQCFANWWSSTTQMICHDGKIYFFDSEGNIMLYWVGTKMWKNLGQRRILESSLCIVEDWLYSCSKEESGKAIINRSSFSSILCDYELSSEQVGFLDMDEKSILNITSIADTLAIFCRSQDGIYVIFFDLVHKTSKVVFTELKLPSKDLLVTVRNDKEAFVLEETGYFWRIRRCLRTNDFELVSELMLWDGTGQDQTRLYGAALVNDHLYIVFNKTEGEPELVVGASLEGVFDKVIPLGYPESSQDLCSVLYCSNVIHTLLPYGLKS
ncbi:kelch-like 40 [Plakobranchus ocellatus]|uniref:Kelch-like 40 n=1 Tax=Plakobranchus ocellatus TaxID=259542 RepID=A0AAV4BY85_9GAST|nr:kelch-like 40 [Plakobranchus ocellatus]